MDIDLKQLRQVANEATPGTWSVDGLEGTVLDSSGGSVAEVLTWREVDAQFIGAFNPAVVTELLDRLEAASK